MILSDRHIVELVDSHQMISPFVESLVRKVNYPVISYGLSSFGYDLRVADEFLMVTSLGGAIVDPKNFTREDNTVELRPLEDETGKYVIIPAHAFVLAKSVEYLRIPRDVMTIVVCKSTYARCGIVPNVTPLEPGWEGFVTLEISNTNPVPAKVYINEGLVQVLFFQGHPPKTSYADRSGKYQYQMGVTLPKV